MGGLVYLRARWYDGSAGTFTARGPFGGFPEQPYSLHPYQYGYANPGRWTDATGKKVWSKDITENNATDQLVHHLYYFSTQRPEVTSIKLLLLGSNGFAGLAAATQQPCLLVSVAELRAPAYAMWALFVKAGAPLDVKPAYRLAFDDYMLMEDYTWKYDMSGNLLYGYVGTFVGFTSWELYGGAGGAQYLDNCPHSPGAMGTGMKECQPSSLDTRTWDQPSDVAAIEAGITLYKNPQGWAFMQPYVKPAHTADIPGHDYFSKDKQLITDKGRFLNKHLEQYRGRIEGMPRSAWEQMREKGEEP